MNKGFALIELLAVLTILAFLFLIFTPKVMDMVNNSKKYAFVDSAISLVETGETYLTKEWKNINKPNVGDGLVVTVNQLVTAGYLDSAGDYPNSVIVIFNNSGTYEVYAFVCNGKYSVSGYRGDDVSDY
ncbi:MAG: type II secretion system protein, partial [Bacilli bacterium]|nr:type II secretion system protein [Bacilli bacterium]